jgi:hypothetical protein
VQFDDRLKIDLTERRTNRYPPQAKRIPFAGQENPAIRAGGVLGLIQDVMLRGRRRGQHAREPPLRQVPIPEDAAD